MTARIAAGNRISPIAVHSPRRKEVGIRTPHAGTGIPVNFSPSVVVRRSPWLVRLFTRHVKRFYLARNFHAVRLSRNGRPGHVPDGPPDRRAKSPSWWDARWWPRAGRVVSGPCPLRAHGRGLAQAPSNFQASGRIWHRADDNARGQGSFSATSCSILARPRTALWITAQGRFADARERPPGVQPGVAHLAYRLEQAAILPLALEYPFWEERRPEALARFGQAILIERGTDRTVEQWRTCIEGALTSTQTARFCEARRRRSL